MTFQIGDKVVYPNQGVGTIENISVRPFGSVSEKFYLLRLGCGGMTVVVPFSNVDNVGLRRVTKEHEISRMLAILASGWYTVRSDWKVRFRENSERMQSGDLLKVAEVFKGLLQLHMEKPLSFREKKMLDRSRHMLIAEISIASNVGEPEAAAMLERSLAKVGLAVAAATA